MGQDLGHKFLPELQVDVLDGVDPEAVDVVIGDPILVDLGHAVDHVGMLGEQVIQTEEIAVE